MTAAVLCLLLAAPPSKLPWELQMAYRAAERDILSEDPDRVARAEKFCRERYPLAASREEFSGLGEMYTQLWFYYSAVRKRTNDRETAKLAELRCRADFFFKLRSSALRRGNEIWFKEAAAR